ncbi:MAG: hypothetical protein ACOWWM_00325 [Desulfobacterales bacterium]
MNRKDKRSVRQWVGIWVLIVVLGPACQSLPTFPSTVQPEDRIPLRYPNGGEGVADTGDVTLEYRYSVAGDADSRTLQVRGAVRHVIFSADAVSIQLLFLADDGRVIDRKAVYYSGYKTRHGGGRFDRSFSVPDGTAALAFSSSVQMSRGHR